LVFWGCWSLVFIQHKDDWIEFLDNSGHWIIISCADRIVDISVFTFQLHNIGTVYIFVNDLLPCVHLLYSAGIPKFTFDKSSKGISQRRRNIIQSKRFKYKFFRLHGPGIRRGDNLYTLSRKTIGNPPRIELESLFLLRPETHVPLKRRAALLLALNSKVIQSSPQ